VVDPRLQREPGERVPLRPAAAEHGDDGADDQLGGDPVDRDPELGLTGFNAAASRTAIGLAVNLPQYRINDTYQFINNVSYLREPPRVQGGHRHPPHDVESFFFPTIRGRLVYPTLQRFVDDVPETATINRALPGGQEIQFYDWTDVYAFFQDEWRVRDNLTLSLGLRYETPGNSIASLYPVNDNDRAHGRRRPALRPDHAAGARHEQLAAAPRLQLEPAHERRRRARLPDRR
jgi:outer membrane receptor protein involved in Fe transport